MKLLFLESNYMCDMIDKKVLQLGKNMWCDPGRGTITRHKNLPL